MELKKLKEREGKILELSATIYELLKEINLELPESYKLELLHPVEYLFLKFLREELVHGKITELGVSQGLPRWAEYKFENGVVKRVKFDEIDSSSK